MSPQLLRPASLPEALALLAEYGGDARLIAGGAALVPLLHTGRIAPRALISLAGIPQLAAIERHGERLRIGAAATIRAVEQASVVREQCPLLAQACHEVGNVRIRNQASVGGNLAEANYGTDLAAALLALDASVTVASLAGERSLPLGELFSGPGATTLRPNECLLTVELPLLPATPAQIYLKFRSRAEKERPCVGVAAVADLADGVCARLRVAVGAASPWPVRLPAVEALAQGRPLDEETIAAVAAGYAAGVDPVSDLRASAWYRTQIIRIYVRRALETVAGRADQAS